MRSQKQVIEDIKNLIKQKGYIYALCMILFEDFHINPEELHVIDYRSRLSDKEASFLIGLVIQNEINFEIPDTHQDLTTLKQQTYELMEKLHVSFMIPFCEKLQKDLKKEHKIEDFGQAQKDFFGTGDMLTEPIFYSGTGVYDFQYLDFLERKYKYDKEWLFENKDFDIEKSKNIVVQIKNILQEKSKKVHLYGLKEKIHQVIEEKKKENPNEDWEKHANEMIPMMEIHQYIELFFNETKTNSKSFSIDSIREESWKSFYSGLIELFVIRKSDFDKDSGIVSFLENFSFLPEKDLNSTFQEIGNFNLFNTKPIIQLDEERYFVPIMFSVFEAVYESPFYWMKEGGKLLSKAGKNRGKVGEEITCEFLSQVFGKDRTFKSVKITTQKGKDSTDIDVLCVLGSKALCVQVKSKKLTELSRMGNDVQLQKDFKGAAQDAYEQCLISRQEILDRDAKFFDENGKELHLSEKIDEVYVMGITTENYPSLTHQASVMIKKTDEDPFAIFLTIFDLEMVTHYLKDPYDFLYYIKQRILLMEHFKADNEMSFLGYHLDQKLWKNENSNLVGITNDFAQLIDRNYYPLKAGLKVSDEEDVIKNRWKDDNFDKLCNRLKILNDPKITDIIFYLLDLSGETRKNIVDFMIQTFQKTLHDDKFHNFSIPPEDSYTSRVGFTYVSLNSNNSEELKKRLLSLCKARKYKSKGDVWIGFGSLKNSDEMIDSIVFSDEKWVYDKELEELSKIMLEGKGQGRYIKIGKKVGRNDRCSCGSGLKYKKCCIK